MAMLAERKRKSKWALNPRGKLWSDDSSKFGQKILEKMGWQSGKGLGVNESGITDHIKVSYKNDSQGIGYKDRGDQWTQHEDQFNSLLSSLNGEVEKQEKPEESIACTGFGFKENKDEKPIPAMKELSGESLEEKSKNSKSRVHYKKFTRGKDISKYSEKDLANIFGKKVNDEPAIETPKAPVLNYGIVNSVNQAQTESDIKEEKDSTPGITIIESKMSMADYFKSKMPKLGSNPRKYTVGPDGVLMSIKNEENQSKESDNYHPSFHLNNFVKEEEMKPKIEKTEEFENERVGFNLENTAKTDLNESELEIPKKKKSKKNKETESPQEKIIFLESVESENLNISEEKNMKPEQNDVVEENVSKIKKKKKSKKENIASDELHVINVQSEHSAENERNSKESEPAEQTKSSFENIPLDTNVEEIPRKTKKKNKKSKIADVSKPLENEIVENTCEAEPNSDNVKLSKKDKKKRKHELVEENIENPSTEETQVVNNKDVSVLNEDLANSEPKKKKRKNKIPVVETADENLETVETNENTEIKKKKKRKLEELTEVSVKENNEHVDEILPNEEEIVNTTKTKKKKASQKIEQTNETNADSIVQETEENKSKNEKVAPKNKENTKVRKDKKKRRDERRKNKKPSNPGKVLRGKVFVEFCRGKEFLVEDAFAGSNLLKISGYASKINKKKTPVTES